MEEDVIGTTQQSSVGNQDCGRDSKIESKIESAHTEAVCGTLSAEHEMESEHAMCSEILASSGRCLETFSYKSPTAMSSPTKIKRKNTDNSSSSSLKQPKIQQVKSKRKVVSAAGKLAKPVTGDGVLTLDLEILTARLKKLNCSGAESLTVEDERCNPNDTRPTELEEEERCEEIKEGDKSRFRAKIAPDSNAAAEEELKKEIR